MDPNLAAVLATVQASDIQALDEAEFLRLAGLFRDLSATTTTTMASASAATEHQNTIVRLDVGGQRFATDQANLLREEGTLFSKLLLMSSSAVFIDRDPTLFHKIINYLRTGRIDLDGLRQGELAQLRDDADYYQIPSLVLLLASARFSPQTKNGAHVSKDGKVASSLQATGNPSAVISSTAFSPHCLEKRVRVIKGSDLMFGVAPSRVLENGMHHLNCGWYVHYTASSDRLCLYGQNGCKGKDFASSSAMHNNTSQCEVTIRVNSEFNISVAIDDCSLGMAFRAVAADHAVPLYLVVWFRDKTGAVELLE